MRKIEHIEQQISELTAGEFSELRDWLLEQDWKAWDAQIESDVRDGKLEKILAEAKADDAARRRERNNSKVLVSSSLMSGSLPVA